MSDKYAVIVISQDELRLVSCDGKEVPLPTLRSLASCEWIEIVHTYYSFVDLDEYAEHLLLIIDEEGKLRSKPINLVASALYGNPLDPIVGDVVIGWDDPLNLDEPDFYAMPEDVARIIYDKLLDFVKLHVKSVSPPLL